jgi:lipopolysaccharide/colanic/teichoic acid biosynthesis glycosyltransferase
MRLHQALGERVALAPFPRADAVAAELGDIPVLAGPDADIGNIEILLIDIHEHHQEQWLDLLAKCYLGGIEVLHWTTYLERRRRRVDVESFDVSHISYDPSQILYARAKRGFDLVGMVLLLPILLPLALLVAAYIYLRDPGPVLFVQTRQGYGGRPFQMYKFRTMHTNVRKGATVDNDDRIIRGCGFIRRQRLDELPQFYNILRGDMSLIGPRPGADYIHDEITTVEPRYAMRLLVLPGITGWAQVNSGHAITTNQEIEKLSYDLYYIKHLSLDLDLSIIFKTIKTLLLRSGAR